MPPRQNGYDLGTNHAHIHCGPGGQELLSNNCCASARGCSKAITAGLADHLVNSVFPDSVGVGEMIGRSIAGLDVCGVARNPERNLQLTSEQAYRACESTQQMGEVYAMAAFYSAFWWKLRQGAAAANKLPEFNKFYVRALALVAGQDDFVSFNEKLLALDQAEFTSSFSPLIQQMSAQSGF